MERINKIIDDFFKNFPENKRKEAEVFSLFYEILPLKHKNYLKIEDVRDGIIFLKTSSPFVKNEISFIKDEIIKKINEKIGESFIKDIKIRRGK